VQDGWKGRILPFDLVQMTTTRRSWTRSAKRKPTSARSPPQIEETLESFSDEDKASRHRQRMQATSSSALP
jgi:type I restriction enzyme M protein